MKTFAAIGAITGWLAVAAQFYLIILNRTATVPETVVRFFSYFTVLTNILVAIGCTALLRERGAWRSFFSRPDVLTAIAVYITIVGMVYNVILRGLWKPEGLQRIVDELLHTIVPLLFVLFWCFYISRYALRWKQALYWLLYPFIYCVYVLVRGALSGFYPYPFIDVKQLGYGPVFLNCLYMMAAFLFFSALYIAIGKGRNKTLI